MEESKRKEIEEKLRKMLISEDKAEQKNETTWERLSETRVIRRRKSSPDALTA